MCFVNCCIYKVGVQMHSSMCGLEGQYTGLKRALAWVEGKRRYEWNAVKRYTGVVSIFFHQFSCSGMGLIATSTEHLPLRPKDVHIRNEEETDAFWEI